MLDWDKDINNAKPESQSDSETSPGPATPPELSKPVKPWWENPGVPTTPITGNINEDPLLKDDSDIQYRDSKDIRW